MSNELNFEKLEAFLRRVPAIRPPIGKGGLGEGRWWVKFAIDIDNVLAWNVVQEFGHVLNYLSLDERLPAAFMPVSPPPYMNGGPAEFLSWVIESKDPSFSPDDAVRWLEGRLPRPVEDVSEWKPEDD